MGEWSEMVRRYPAIVARWQEAPVLTVESYRFAVPKDAQAAYDFYTNAGLAGDPQVARTFPAEGLAVVPLPRDDALLAAMPHPPQTWLHSFRHECAHLLSLGVPALRVSPVWFQEGFAELWCAPDAGRDGRLQPLPQEWPHWGDIHHWWQAELVDEPGTVPGEVLYAWYAEKALLALRKDLGPTPWTGSSALDSRTGEDGSFHGLRGRHADWDPASGTYRIFTRLGKQVDLDLHHPWDGSHPLALEMQLGRSPGQVEAGVVLWGADPAAGPAAGPAADPAADVEHPAPDETRIRLRYGLGGGFTAYPEVGRNGGFEALHAPQEGREPGRSRIVHLQRSGDLLQVVSEDFSRSFDLQELGLRWPLRLRMVVRDGAFQLQMR